MSPKKHKVWPEPGAWIADMPKGIQQPQPPELLVKNKLSAHEIREIVAYEGLGFCIHSYIPSQKIEDAKLRLLWMRANVALQAVVDFLEKLPPENPTNRTKNKLRYNKGVAETKTNPLDIGRKL